MRWISRFFRRGRSQPPPTPSRILVGLVVNHIIQHANELDIVKTKGGTETIRFNAKGISFTGPYVTSLNGLVLDDDERQFLHSAIYQVLNWRTQQRLIEDEATRQQLACTMIERFMLCDSSSLSLPSPLSSISGSLSSKNWTASTRT